MIEWRSRIMNPNQTKSVPRTVMVDQDFWSLDTPFGTSQLPDRVVVVVSEEEAVLWRTLDNQRDGGFEELWPERVPDLTISDEEWVILKSHGWAEQQPDPVLRQAGPSFLVEKPEWVIKEVESERRRLSQALEPIF